MGVGVGAVESLLRWRAGRGSGLGGPHGLTSAPGRVLGEQRTANSEQRPRTAPPPGGEPPEEPPVEPVEPLVPLIRAAVFSSAFSMP